MSRGLGHLQREIKRVLDVAYKAEWPPLRFADLRAIFVINDGGRPERGDTLEPTQERALKCALKTLVDRRDVLIIGGKGGVRDPYRYVTVESFAAATGETIKDNAHAKEIVAELMAAVGSLAS
jgi:hypothetical protein